MERRPAPDHVTASPASAKVLVKAASVRISVLALLCITPVVWFAASELPDSAPYYLWGGVTALVLTGGIALLCRAGLSGGSPARPQDGR